MRYLIHILVLLGIAIVANAKAVERIEIDAGKRLSDVKHGPVGLCMNVFLDRYNQQFVRALNRMHMRTLRYPMGTYANLHMWNEEDPAAPLMMIRDRDLPTAGGWVKEDFTIKVGINFDEFVKLCRESKSEPVVMVGLEALIYEGDKPRASKEELIDSIQAWVRYANVTKGYNIKYWELGNECDLDDPAKTIGRWPLDTYIETVKEVSAAMKAVDPTIRVGANSMTKAEFVPLIRGCGSSIDFLVTHNYASHVRDYGTYLKQPYDWTALTSNAVDAIRKTRPGLELLITEFNGQGRGTWANGWVSCRNFEMAANLLTFPEVRYIHFWETMFFSKTGSANHAFSKDGKYKPTGMGMSLQILAEHLRDHMVQTSPQKNGVNSWASVSEDGTGLSVWLLNKRDKPIAADVNINRYTGATDSRRWVMKSDTPHGLEVRLVEGDAVSAENNGFEIKLPAASVTAVRLEPSPKADP